MESKLAEPIGIFFFAWLSRFRNGWNSVGLQWVQPPGPWDAPFILRFLMGRL